MVSSDTLSPGQKLSCPKKEEFQNVEKRWESPKFSIKKRVG